MKAWFETLDERERIMVVVAAAFSVLALVYLALWRPIGKSTDRLEKQVISQTETLNDLIRLEGRVGPPGGNAEASARGQSIVVLISQSVGRYELSEALKSSQPSGDNSIRVQFENAAFDTLIEWLGELKSKHGLSVRGASFNRLEQNGRVDSILTLERR